MSLATRQTDQVKIVPDFTLILLRILTDNKIFSKTRNYLHIFKIFPPSVQKLLFLNFSKLKTQLISMSVPPAK